MTGTLSAERQQVLHRVGAVADQLVELAGRIHAHPELGRCEHRAVAWTAELLERHGFQVEVGAGGVETGLVATAGSGGPTVGFLGEYDALPEVGHACGHNLLDAARALALTGADILLDPDLLPAARSAHG